MPYVRTRLGRLFYDERGRTREKGDPAIVLLHGLLFDGGMWRGQLDPLSDLGRVVVFDGPGHGKSEPPPRFMLEEHADALVDAFGDLEIDRAVIIGLSWGGMVGMRFALQHASRTAALALLDTSAEAQTLAEKVRYRAFIAMHRRVGFPHGLYHREVVPKMFAPKTIAERPDLIDATYRRTMGFDRDGVAKASLAVVVHRKNILESIDKIRVPTLVMVGRHDQSTPVAKSEHMVQKISGAKLVVLEDLGHMSALEDPEAVNAHLVPFVRDVVARPVSVQHGA
jgi:3-oxoadipate enol-lactonase